MPGLPEDTTGKPGDVSVVRGSVARGNLAALTGELAWRREGDRLVFSWEPAGRIMVEGGNSIVVDAPPEADPRAIALFINGPGLNAVVRQRGMVMLHASGVAIDGGCVAIVGASGMGKSTLAAALAERGFSLVADDGIVYDNGLIMPAYPGIRLWSSSRTSLGLVGEPLLTGADKHVVHTPHFQAEPLPLRVLLLLAHGDRIRLESVEGSRAPLELIANSSRAIPLAGIDPAGQLRASSRIVATSRIFRLTRPRDIGLLGSLCDQVVACARGMSL